MSTPLVSVITATYNMGRFVTQAADSVLNQDYANLEWIVIDDGSTDETPEVLAGYRDDERVTIIHQDNAGQTVAKNRGIAIARGDYVGFCDADNIWMPSKLTRQVSCFSSADNLGVVYGDIILIDDEGCQLPSPPIQRHSGRITAYLLVDNFVTFNTTLVPRRILEEMNGFDERLSMAIDYDLWLRISVKYNFLYLPEPLVQYRIWGGQMSHRTGERMDNYFRLLERFLADNPQLVSSSEADLAWAHSLVTRGRWLASVGRHQEAWDDYRKAFSHRPFDLRLWKSVARLVLRRK